MLKVNSNKFKNKVDNGQLTVKAAQQCTKKQSISVLYKLRCLLSIIVYLQHEKHTFDLIALLSSVFYINEDQLHSFYETFKKSDFGTFLAQYFDVGRFSDVIIV